MSVKNFLSLILSKGYDLADDDETRLKKMALMLVPLIIGPAAFIWGSIYFYLGYPFSGMIPMSYSIISALSLAYFFKTKKTDFLQYSQLILVLILPFLLMWSLGGFAAGSLVMVWAIFTPVAAAIFYDKRAALRWFLAYLVLIIISTLIDTWLSQTITPLPQMARTVFFLLNMGCASSGLYLLVSYAVHEEKHAILRLRDEGERLMQAQSELVREKRNAEAANSSKTTFLANMSHELRTPLNAIIGFSDSIRSQFFGPIEGKKYVEYASDIHNSGLHLLQIINDILDVSVVEAGKLELQKEPIDMDALVGQCLNLVHGRASDTGVTVTKNIDPAEDSFVADELRLKQVLVNLLNNAVKFTKPGGSVVVLGKAMGTGGYVLSVTDTGIGMTENGIAKAVIPFERPDEHDFNPEGTGLGLPLSKQLVELHGGTLEITSTPGKGTTVTISLP